MTYKKRLISIVLIVVLTLSVTACKKNEAGAYEPLAEEDEAVYHIAAFSDADLPYYNYIYQGFFDALCDLFGKNHIVMEKEVGADTQLIFADGPNSITDNAETYRDIPIVAAGAMDYQHLLHLTAGVGNKWNQKTGTNVTGVSSKPNIEDQVSLIIETTEDLKSVGLLYTPEDSDSLYQLGIIEKYLDQAAIPWKEYAIPTDNAESDEPFAESTEDSSAKASDYVITKTKDVAPSVTEGQNLSVDIFGGTNLIDGIIAPSSAHTAQISPFWEASLSAENTEPLPEDASLEEVVTYAANECSCLYITTGSALRSKSILSTISEIATDANVTTVGGDSEIGDYTLTSTYIDPYGIGYSAGKLAYRILVNGDEAGSIKIKSPDLESVKLYNEKIAQEFDLTFPKSFHEISEFKKTYEIGSSTSRVSVEE